VRGEIHFQGELNLWRGCIHIFINGRTTYTISIQSAISDALQMTMRAVDQDFAELQRAMKEE
jgi:hypothetical protein